MQTRGLGNASFLRKIIVALVIAALFTLIAGKGGLFRLDRALSDAMYDMPKSHDGVICVVGMDQKALDEIGPMPWDREVMATVIRNLNANPDAKPAVIALDVLYTGTTSKASDDALVAACREGGNVVAAEAANFTDLLVTEGDNFYVNPFGITGVDRVIPELSKATLQGHINAMQDKDGILRHGLLWITDPNTGAKTQLFARVIYEKYCEATGQTPNRLPDTDENGFFTIPFTVTPGNFYDGISVADIYFGRVDGAYFEDCIVLIGPYAAGLQDQYKTSIDHASAMYGIDVQGNVIQSFLDNRYQREAKHSWQLILLFVLSAGSVIFLWDRKVRWSVVWWIGFAGSWLLLCKIFGNKGILLEPLWIPLAVTILFVAFVAINYTQASLAKHKVTSMFKRYVDPSVINELFREGTDSLGLGGKVTDIAALFVDIRGFTTMSEALPATEVVEILNQYLSLTTKCVMDNHGTLDKFVGDCTMAIWNAPLPQEDYVLHACQCALDMVKGAAELTKELEAKYGRTVAFGVGVHCGKAVVGNIGSSMRMDFTAIGDTVNTAARLEANAPGGCVYVSKAVIEALGDRAIATSLGTGIKLKGKADGFEIFSLEDIRGKAEVSHEQSSEE